MIVSNPVRPRRSARVNVPPAPPLPAEQQSRLHPLQAYFRDRRQRVILGTPEPAPCPFCARHDALVIVNSASCALLYHVSCERCGACGGEAPSRRAAARLWNTAGVTDEHRFYRLLCGPGEA